MAFGPLMLLLFDTPPRLSCTYLSIPGAYHAFHIHFGCSRQTRCRMLLCLYLLFSLYIHSSRHEAHSTSCLLNRRLLGPVGRRETLITRGPVYRGQTSLSADVSTSEKNR